MVLLVNPTQHWFQERMESTAKKLKIWLEELEMKISLHISMSYLLKIKKRNSFLKTLFTWLVALFSN